MALTAATNPAVEGLDVDYLVVDSTIGTVSDPAGTTGPARQDSVTFTGQSTGTTDVFVVGGGDADVIEMTVENASGGPQPNQSPTANFTIDRRGQSGNVDLDGSPSTDRDGQILAWEWEWERNGQTERRTGKTVPVKQNVLPVDTEVRLTVTDDDGATASTTRTVN